MVDVVSSSHNLVRNVNVINVGQEDCDSTSTTAGISFVEKVVKDTSVGVSSPPPRKKLRLSKYCVGAGVKSSQNEIDSEVHHLDESHVRSLPGITRIKICRMKDSQYPFKIKPADTLSIAEKRDSNVDNLQTAAPLNRTDTVVHSGTPAPKTNDNSANASEKVPVGVPASTSNVSVKSATKRPAASMLDDFASNNLKPSQHERETSRTSFQEKTSFINNLGLTSLSNQSTLKDHKSASEAAKSLTTTQPSTEAKDSISSCKSTLKDLIGASNASKSSTTAQSSSETKESISSPKSTSKDHKSASKASKSSTTTQSSGKTKDSISSPRITRNERYYGTGRLPCPDLGEGWEFEQIVRQQGKSVGKYDVYYYSPKNVRLRSKVKLSNHLRQGVDLSRFDYNRGIFPADGEHVPKKDALLGNQLRWIYPSKAPVSHVVDNRRKSGGAKQADSSGIASARSSSNKKATAKPQIKVKMKQPRKNRKPQKIKSIKNDDECAGDRATELDLSQETAQKKEDAEQKVDVENVVEAFAAFKKEVLSRCRDMMDCTDATIEVAWSHLADRKKSWYGEPRNWKIEEPTRTCKNVSGKAVRKTGKTNRRYSLPIASYIQQHKRKKISRCGVCPACMAPNCGKCSSCRDMAIFGGRSVKKQGCLSRRCLYKSFYQKRYEVKGILSPTAPPLAPTYPAFIPTVPPLDLMVPPLDPTDPDSTYAFHPRNDTFHSSIATDTPLTPARQAEETPLCPVRQIQGTPLTPVSHVQHTPFTPARRAQDTPLTSAQDTPSTPARRAQDTPSTSAQHTLSTPARHAQDTPLTSAQDIPSTPARRAQDTPSTSAQNTLSTPATRAQDTPSTSAQDTLSTPARHAQDTPLTSAQDTLSTPARHAQDTPLTSAQDTPSTPARRAQDTPSTSAQYTLSTPARRAQDTPLTSAQDTLSTPARHAQDTPLTSAQDTLSTPARRAQDTPSTSAQDTPSTPARHAQDTPLTSAQDIPSTPARRAQDTPSTSAQDTLSTPARRAQDTPSTSAQDTFSTPARRAQDTPSTSAQDALSTPARHAQDTPLTSAQDTLSTPARRAQDTPSTSAQDTPLTPARHAEDLTAHKISISTSGNSDRRAILSETLNETSSGLMTSSTCSTTSFPNRTPAVVMSSNSSFMSVARGTIRASPPSLHERSVLEQTTAPDPPSVSHPSVFASLIDDTARVTSPGTSLRSLLTGPRPSITVHHLPTPTTARQETIPVVAEFISSRASTTSATDPLPSGSSKSKINTELKPFVIPSSSSPSPPPIDSITPSSGGLTPFVDPSVLQRTLDVPEMPWDSYLSHPDNSRRRRKSAHPSHISQTVIQNSFNNVSSTMSGSFYNRSDVAMATTVQKITNSTLTSIRSHVMRGSNPPTSTETGVGTFSSFPVQSPSICAQLTLADGTRGALLRRVAPRRVAPRRVAPRRLAPRIATPRIATPRIATPHIATPRIATPRIATPRIATPHIATPRIATPRIATPHLMVAHIVTPHLAPATGIRMVPPHGSNTGTSFCVAGTILQSTVSSSSRLQSVRPGCIQVQRSESNAHGRHEMPAVPAASARRFMEAHENRSRPVRPTHNKDIL